MYQLEIFDSCYSDITREANRDDEWDKDDISYSYSVTGVRTLGEKDQRSSYSDVIVPFEVVQNKEYYLVYVTYSSGDSFHHSEGHVFYIDLFESKEKAQALAEKIEEHYSYSDNGSNWNAKKTRPKNHNEFELSYLNEANEKMKTAVPWTGYFERLTNITIETVRHFNKSDNKGKIIYR
jgi:hypothetical protein